MNFTKPAIIFLVIITGLIIISKNAVALESNQDDAEITPTVDVTNTAELNEKNTRATQVPPNIVEDTNDILFKTVLPDNNILYPDLVLADPEQVVILSDEKTRNLQFNTAFANLGEGDLNLIGVNENNGHNAIQVLKTSTGQEYNVNIGEFQLDDEHNHWHLDNFANYELWSINDKGEKENLLANSVKVSFCIWDYKEYTEDFFDDLAMDILPKDRQFPECNYDFQGLTVGWFDEYDAFTFGQSIDILDIPDGKYILRTTINMDRDVIESNYDNNETNIYIEILGKLAKIIEMP